MAARKPNSNPIDKFWNWVDQLPLWVRIPIYRKKIAAEGTRF